MEHALEFNPAAWFYCYQRYLRNRRVRQTLDSANSAQILTFLEETVKYAFFRGPVKIPWLFRIGTKI